MWWNKLFKSSSSKDEVFMDLEDLKVPEHDFLSNTIKFVLSLNDLKIGLLSFDAENERWYFEYASEFKDNADEYNLIVGFPNLDKRYESDELWPFFIVRIPGLKQPSVREILKKENIDPTNNVKLLERFGKRTISNPFSLELV